MSDAYLSWEDLVEKPGATGSASDVRAQSDGDLEELLDLEGLPDELRVLIERRSQLRRRLDAFAGGSDPVDPRDEARFQVPVHTRESRIEERRERRREEADHLARLARKQELLLARRRATAEQEARDKARARTVSDRRRGEREEFARSESRRRHRLEEEAAARWAAQRTASHAAARKGARKQRQWESERARTIHAASVSRVLERRDERARLEARLDRRDNRRAVHDGWEAERDSRRARASTTPGEADRDHQRDARRLERP